MAFLYRMRITEFTLWLSFPVSCILSCFTDFLCSDRCSLTRTFSFRFVSLYTYYHNLYNLWCTIKKPPRNKRSDIYPEITKLEQRWGEIPSIPFTWQPLQSGRTHLEGEGEQRLQKLAQYNHHLAVIHLLQYCVITNQSGRSHLVGDENLTCNISLSEFNLTLWWCTSTRQMNLFKNMLLYIIGSSLIQTISTMHSKVWPIYILGLN